jgi:glycosyltransferase involved in cell wall biosynthesis
VPDIELTICTRESEWKRVKSEYSPLPGNVHIIHESGLKMESELVNSDIAVLFVKPNEYWEFAVPVKRYEYIGFEKAVLASKGTLAGDFVADNDIGWSVPYDKHALKDLLLSVSEDRKVLDKKTENLERIASRSSWEARAKKVISTLKK